MEALTCDRCLVQTSRPPMIDSDCYWNYRQARCEFSEFCEYQYNFGDVTLDQSCRMRASKKLPAPIHSGELFNAATASSTTGNEDVSMSPAGSYCAATTCSSCAAYNECTPLDPLPHSEGMPRPATARK